MGQGHVRGPIRFERVIETATQLRRRRPIGAATALPGRAARARKLAGVGVAGGAAGLRDPAGAGDTEGIVFESFDEQHESGVVPSEGGLDLGQRSIVFSVQHRVRMPDRRRFCPVRDPPARRPAAAALSLTVAIAGRHGEANRPGFDPTGRPCTYRELLTATSVRRWWPIDRPGPPLDFKDRGFTETALPRLRR